MVKQCIKECQVYRFIKKIPLTKVRRWPQQFFLPPNGWRIRSCCNRYSGIGCLQCRFWSVRRSASGTRPELLWPRESYRECNIRTVRHLPQGKLPEWDAIFTQEKRDELYKLEKKSHTVIKPPKVGRNDPCPCGSGKKYKKCCGKNA